MTKENRSIINSWLAQGWNIKSETKEYYVVTKNTQKFGIHIFLFFVGLWFTGANLMLSGQTTSIVWIFIPNIAYWLLSKKERKIFKE